MRTIKEFERGDGAHCGLGDWYPEKEAALAAALKKFVKNKTPFDTGWYGSKKEIASARIYTDSKPGGIYVEVSVSDDFDTSGTGSTPVAEATLEGIREAIYTAWDLAEQNQKDNRAYAGYSIIHWTREITWRNPGDKRKRTRSKMPHCLDYYIVDVLGMDSPPGDNYYHWGWQSDPDESDSAGQNPDPSWKMPKTTQAKFEVFAQKISPGKLRIGDWEIRAWDLEAGDTKDSLPD